MASSLAKRLTYRITAVVLVMMAVIAGFTYFTVKKYMLQEAQERYEGVLQRDHEESRRRLLECTYLATSHTGGYWHESGGISPDAHPRFVTYEKNHNDIGRMLWYDGSDGAGLSSARIGAA